MLTTIWTEPDAAEWLFLFAAIAFVIAAILYVPRNPHTHLPYAPVLLALGLALGFFGFLAL
jgi:hypothetical protein